MSDTLTEQDRELVIKRTFDAKRMIFGGFKTIVSA